MTVSSKHPLYAERVADWEQLKDTHRGQRAVKDKGTFYLPATQGMIEDGMSTEKSPGTQAYNAYRSRANFPDLVKQAVEGMVGIMHREPAVFELPSQMEPLVERATVDGEGLHTLLRRINEAQMLYGRYGLLVEAPDGKGPDALPFIAPYVATTIINWDVGHREQGRQRLELVVLNESENERQASLEWQFQEKYRVLIMGGQLQNVGQGNQEARAAGEYNVAVFRDSGLSLGAGRFIQPQIAGKKLDRIPFVFINTNDLVPAPDDPPLLGLSNLALTIYRGDADYRQNLFMQGQDTLVIIGATDSEATRTGAGAKIELSDKDADAKYIGVNEAGLSEQREALQNDKAMAAEMGTRILDIQGTSQQSGDALRIRVAAKTATVASIAQTGAEGLEEALRIVAEWIGANPKEVKVKPNMDFTEDELQGRTVLELTTAKNMGLPLSRRSIHRFLQKHDLTEMDFEEEMAEIEGEGPLPGNEGLGAPGQEPEPEPKPKPNPNPNPPENT